jgi:predicted  nucleic acid-binding Zn-ribbon protein
MTRNPIELLVLYQDLDLMLKETADAEATMGFEMEGRDKLRKAMDDIAKNIPPRFLRTYQRLHTRFKRPIVPVQNDVCLGCFAKLPTSYGEKGRKDQMIYSCEQCGRILYWVE